MKIDLVQTIRGTPETKTVQGVEVPALPRVGDYCCHDPGRVSGTVTGVMFYWPEDGGELVIEVRLQ